MQKEHEVFMIEATKCKRCGGILTSKQAVLDGIGHVCKQKLQSENDSNKPVDGQLSFGEETEPVLGLNNTDERRCRVCGCTWENGCVGGCWWIEHDLCSKCTGA